MPKYPDETQNVSVPPSGRWVWNDEAKTVEFDSPDPVEKEVSRQRKSTNVSFRELQLRSEWLADVYTLNHRGRHSLKKSLNSAHMNAYRSSVMRGQGDHITIDDVKQVAVSLLQDNYTLPIPFSFLALLKRKEFDEVLTALLLYLSCFFEHKSLENKAKPLIIDIITERQRKAEALAKKEISQKNLAACYFSLIMDLEVEQHQRTSYRKGRLSENAAEWLLHACLYSFFCYVAWITFGRKDLKDIQEEVGRLLYSDTFNTAVRRRADGDPEMTSSNVDGSVKTGDAESKETGSNRKYKHWNVKERSSCKRPSLSSVVHKRSPLMVSLLPSPKELSPHLFSGYQAGRQTPLPMECCDTEALTEELDQQLENLSFGILGKPLRQFNSSSLIPLGENQNNSDEEDDREAAKSNKDHPAFCLRGSTSSFTGPRRLTDPPRYDRPSHLHPDK